MQTVSGLAKGDSEVIHELDQRKVSEGGAKPVAVARQKQMS